jgi:hypothetical protein
VLRPHGRHVGCTRGNGLPARECGGLLLRDCVDTSRDICSRWFGQQTFRGGLPAQQHGPSRGFPVPTMSREICGKLLAGQAFDWARERCSLLVLTLRREIFGKPSFSREPFRPTQVLCGSLLLTLRREICGKLSLSGEPFHDVGLQPWEDVSGELSGRQAFRRGRERGGEICGDPLGHQAFPDVGVKCRLLGGSWATVVGPMAIYQALDFPL